MTEPASFTEEAYGRILDMARDKYHFNGSDLSGVEPVVCWRHDVDYSPQRAVAMARMEADRKLRCVYHILPSGRYYNVLEPGITEIFREIAALGHEIGLHFDMDIFPEGRVNNTEFLSRFSLEQQIIEYITGTPLRSFSFHNHILHKQNLSQDAEINGLRNLASPLFYHDIEYLSDSNGIWRGRSLEELLAHPPFPKLQVLTHPVWWPPESITPYQRFLRVVEGRHASSKEFYREIMLRDGRLKSIRTLIGIE